MTISVCQHCQDAGQTHPRPLQHPPLPSPPQDPSSFPQVHPKTPSEQPLSSYNILRTTPLLHSEG